MATVTKLKSEVFNKNLPVLLPDGGITNYYFGKFVNTITAKGYQLSSAEKNALSAFIESGLNSWIDYVDYFMPFIGDEDHPNAGTVPLIDNINDYKMEEYGDESYASLFEYDDNNGKILSVHNNADLVMRTPLVYGKYRGGCYINSVKYEAFSQPNGKNQFLMTEDVLDSGVYYYIRLRYAYSSTSQKPIISIQTSSNGSVTIDRTIIPVNYSIENNKNAIVWAGIFKDDLDNVNIRQGYSIPGDKFNRLAVTTSPQMLYADRNYGKLGTGRLIEQAYLKCHAFINPLIPENLVYKLADDIETLVSALGR